LMGTPIGGELYRTTTVALLFLGTKTCLSDKWSATS
jgi:hypothetical protein